MTGFRNLASQELVFDPQVSIVAFTGINGQGKTNLLEAIYLCTLSKSFRTQKIEELVGFDDEACQLKLKTTEDFLEVSLVKSPPKKQLRINGVKKSSVEFVGHLKSVFFSPDDLAHMAFAPKFRRRYLDVLLSQLSHVYLYDLMQYQEALKQRNALLKSIKAKRSSPSEILFWNERLAELGLKILQARKSLIQDLSGAVLKHYQAISHSADEIEIVYHSSLHELETTEVYLHWLSSRFDEEVQSGQTSVGPHRDDLVFKLRGAPMLAFSSRGEWRSLVLALKFAEIDHLKNMIHEAPILLLDDVFSELDEGRQHYLFEAIEGIQTFVTGTQTNFFEPWGTSVSLFKVEGGKVEKP